MPADVGQRYKLTLIEVSALLCAVQRSDQAAFDAILARTRLRGAEDQEAPEQRRG